MNISYMSVPKILWFHVILFNLNFVIGYNGLIEIMKEMIPHVEYSECARNIHELQ